MKIKMNFNDTKTTSHQNFYRKYLEATDENWNFDIRVYRVKQ